LADLRSAIGFSSFGVLLYNLIANVAAYTQSPDRRRFPRVLQLVGLAGCVILVVTLPLRAVLVGTVVFAVGIVYRAIRVRIGQSRPS
jgi:APA family basic amino acid/polyamine antiporter